MSSTRIIKRADPSSIHNKVLVGYQGWFTCAGDGPPVHQGHHGWLHWFDKPLSEGGHPNFDLFPDVTDYTPEELYPAPGLTFPHNNQPAKLFSSRNPTTVNRHFHWMARHGIDGAFLQRFATQCEVDGNQTSPTADLMRLRDEVLDKVRAAAEKEHRAWAIMYDVSGVPSDRIEHILRVDWNHLVNDKRILDSPYYLKEKGQPVVAIWGFGFVKDQHNPQTVASIVRHIKSVTPGGAYIWGGVPSQWRTLSGDMISDPGLLDVFKHEFNALSPWTVGRYHNLSDMDKFCEERTVGDFKELKDLPNRIDYIPTIWPGGSSHNLSSGRMEVNDAPRLGGKFFWRQLWNVKHLGARTIYVAMFDEYDEGTAVLPSVPLKRSLPKCDDPNRQFPFIALDADGVDNLSPDWYLRICGFASEVMKDERRVYEDLPKKELDDYWATRPKYETFQAFAASSSSNNQSELPYLSGGGESSSAGSSSVTNTGGGSVSAPKKAEPERKTPMRSQTGAWGALMDDEEGAPPPYTLEADEMPASPVSVVPAPSSTAAATTSAPSTTNTATTAPSIAPSVTSPTPSSTTGTPASSTHGVGVHRTSSYAAPSSNPNQGATGLGRATTYTPTSSQTTNTQSVSTPTSARPLFAPPSFAPPSTAPPRPNSASAHHRPPIHPASSLAGSSTPPTQSPYKGPGSLPMHPGMSPNPSATNVTHHLANMSIGSSGHNTYTNPNPANIPSHPTGPNPAGGYHPTLVGSATGSMPSTPGAGPNYPPASTATPHGPTGGFVVPTPTQQNATSPWGGQAQPNSYMSAGQGLPFGGGGSTPGGVQPAGVGHSQSPAHPWNPPSSGPTQQQEWINPLAGSSSATAGSYPPAHGFTSPVPGAVTPIGQPTTYPGQPSSYPTSSGAETPSSYPLPGGGPTTSSYPGVAANSSQGWTSAYPAPGSYPPPGVGPITGVNPPTLPPRPPQGQPGGSQNQTLLGGIVKQATGIVDRVAGESTRIQIEKGVISAAQTGSKLLGKLTK